METSKLNWSSRKPLFEEVEGKTVVVESIFTGGTSKLNIVDCDARMYEIVFDDYFSRYAIIDTDPEPMEYKGKLPIVLQSGLNSMYLSWCALDGDESYDTPFFSTKSEAIESWNRFVKAMEAAK